jgi:hypothetical protein
LIAALARARAVAPAAPPVVQVRPSPPPPRVVGRPAVVIDISAEGRRAAEASTAMGRRAADWSSAGVPALQRVPDLFPPAPPAPLKPDSQTLQSALQRDLLALRNSGGTTGRLMRGEPLFPSFLEGTAQERAARRPGRAIEEAGARMRQGPGLSAAIGRGEKPVDASRLSDLNTRNFRAMRDRQPQEVADASRGG